LNTLGLVDNKMFMLAEEICESIKNNLISNLPGSRITYRYIIEICESAKSNSGRMNKSEKEQLQK